jgi:gliding motility-associated-like protein
LPLKNPNFAVSSGASYCATTGNHTVSTTNLVDLGASPTFKWYINGLYENTLDGKTFYDVTKSIATTTKVKAVIDAAYITANIPCSQNVGPISKTATVVVNPQPDIKFIVRGDTICTGATANIFIDDTSSTKGVSYSWWYNPSLPTSINSTYLGATTLPVLPNNFREGYYYVKATNPGNCTDDDAFYLNVEEPKVSAGDTKEIEEGKQVALEGTANQDIVVFNWTPIQTIYGYENPFRPIVGPLVDTDYKLVGISKAGCIDSSFVTVKVIQKIRIPNAFSPNGDGKNETWHIFNIDDYPANEVTVYNRWGSVVFNTKNGQPLSTGTYYYIVEIGKGNNPSTGALTIVR